MNSSIKNSLDDAITKFETDYRDSIHNSAVDIVTSDLLYALGASIKDTFNSFAEILVQLTIKNSLMPVV
ncbi:Uncharacterised protein [Acetobacterium wieringae]|uniref:hypothetical protein n=1 Tax=Acetobacterium wieringae TaxID=52694 RepID=UPI001DB64805|nr:hypothetical protein [Acetobacterium wieringae]VUZ26856.1 Uncharacterised protein [Acetobacterium wieringae]